MTQLFAVNVVFFRPDADNHGEALRDFAELVAAGARRAGFKTTLATNVWEPACFNIVVGWHFLSDKALASLEGRGALYNLEQLGDHEPQFRDRLVRWSSRFEIWDYSERNLRTLRTYGAVGLLRWVPVGHAPELARIPRAPEQHIDVLFYGSVNPRRAEVLHALKASGLRVRHVFGVYGRERDALIARAKVVLNLHYYETSIFEIVRVSYLLSNAKAVVAEGNPETTVESDLIQGVALVPYESLVSTCHRVVHDDHLRSALEQRGHAAIARRVESDILARALDRRPAPSNIPRAARVFLHHPALDGDQWATVLRWYWATFLSREDVVLLLAPDASSGDFHLDSALAGIEAVARSAGMEGRKRPPVVVVPPSADNTALHALYENVDCVLTLGDAVARSRAASFGKVAIERLAGPAEYT